MPAIPLFFFLPDTMPCIPLIKKHIFSTTVQITPIWWWHYHEIMSVVISYSLAVANSWFYRGKSNKEQPLSDWSELNNWERMYSLMHLSNYNGQVMPLNAYAHRLKSCLNMNIKNIKNKHNIYKIHSKWHFLNLIKHTSSSLCSTGLIMKVSILLLFSPSYISKEVRLTVI